MRSVIPPSVYAYVHCLKRVIAAAASCGCRTPAPSGRLEAEEDGRRASSSCPDRRLLLRSREQSHGIASVAHYAPRVLGSRCARLAPTSRGIALRAKIGRRGNRARKACRSARHGSARHAAQRTTTAVRQLLTPAEAPANTRSMRRGNTQQRGSADASHMV
jgi:hypothetical protein